jgi:hypothetical protein
MEAAVSALLRESLWFRCVAIADIQERNQYEEVLIATVAACQVCCPSGQWLGRYAYNTKVLQSGLWNSNHVRGEIVSHEGMDRFLDLVAQTKASYS